MFIFQLVKKNGTFYTGVTSDLKSRIWEHKNSVNKGFTDKFNVKKLVYYELSDDIDLAIKREKLLKRWRRVWKLKLIEDFNPCWHDLYDKDIQYW